MTFTKSWLCGLLCLSFVCTSTEVWSLPQSRPTTKRQKAQSYESLLAQLRSPVRKTRDRAIQAFAKRKDRQTLLVLTRQFRAEPWWVRAAAIEAVGRVGKQASPALISLFETLRDPVAWVRAEARRSLHRIGKAALPALFSGLTHAHWQIRQESARTIALFGPHALSTFPRLLLCLKERDKDVRKACRLAIVSIGHKAMPALRLAMVQQDQRVRKNIALVFAKMGKQGEQELRNAAKHIDWRVRYAAAYGLRQAAHSQKSQQVLLALLSDKDWLVKSTALQALAAFGKDAKSAIPMIVKRLQDKEQHVRLHAGLAIASIGTTPKTTLPTLFDLLGRVNGNKERKQLEQAFAKAKPAHAVAFLLPKLAHDVSSQRQRALLTLGTLSTLSNTQLITIFYRLNDRSRQVRATAASVLRAKKQKLFSALRQALESRDNALLRAAASLVGTTYYSAAQRIFRGYGRGYPRNAKGFLIASPALIKALASALQRIHATSQPTSKQSAPAPYTIAPTAIETKDALLLAAVRLGPQGKALAASLLPFLKEGKICKKYSPRFSRDFRELYMHTTHCPPHTVLQALIRSKAHLPSAFDALQRLTKSKRTNIRRGAYQAALVVASTHPSIGLLLQRGLAEADNSISDHLLDVLLSWKPAQICKHQALLLKELTEPSRQRGLTAAQLLTRCGKSTLPALRQIAKAPKHKGRANAIMALGSQKAQSPADLEIYKKALAGEELGAQQAAIAAVGQIPAHREVFSQALVERLKSPNPRTRQLLGYTIAQLKLTAALPLLVQYSLSGTRFSRMAMLRTIGKTGGLSQVQTKALLPLLFDKDGGIAMSAAEAMSAASPMSLDMLKKAYGEGRLDNWNRRILAKSIVTLTKRAPSMLPLFAVVLQQSDVITKTQALGKFAKEGPRSKVAARIIAPAVTHKGTEQAALKALQALGAAALAASPTLEKHCQEHPKHHISCALLQTSQPSK